MSAATNPADDRDPELWTEEQLRYEVLRVAHDRAGPSCERPVADIAIGADLAIHYEDLFRVTRFLIRHGYLADAGGGSAICITPQGIEYIRTVAGRRRSIRVPAISRR